MKAFILAAGMGTRLRPLTDLKPKALVEIAGKPMIEHVIQQLSSQGFSDIIVNIHHHARVLRSYLEQLSLRGLSIRISDETEQLMDTGGAVMHARQLLDDGSPFLIQNVDIISNIDYRLLVSAHERNQALATLALRNRPTSRSLMVDQDLNICGWTNHETGETRICYEAEYRLLAFSGIHVLSPEVFTLMNPGPFSIIDFYLDMASRGRKIVGHLHDEDYWLDLGRKEQIEEAEIIIRSMGESTKL